MDTEYDLAVQRLGDAILKLTPGTPEWDALAPEYDQAFRAWKEYHETECPICRRINERLKSIADADRAS